MASEFEKKLFKAAVVNTDELVKAQARDVGDVRMTESKEDREANWFVRTGKRIWKHNIAQEWYRQREISRAKKEILESDNLYAGEKDFDPDQKTTAASKTVSDEAMQAIVERFTSEYENEMLKEEEQESKHTLEDESTNANIKDLIKQYAGSVMSDAAFDEKKKRILSVYDKQYASAKSKHADNLLSIAKEVRESVTHGTKLAELDFEVEITLGTARESLSTEAHLNSFDSAVEKLQNTKIGKYIANEPAVLGIAAGLWEVGRNTLQRVTRSKAVQWGTFGLAAAASAGISGIKERARVTRERAQHQREAAKGIEFKDADMKRRKEMQENSYDTKKATMIIQNLTEDLSKIEEGEVSPEEMNEIMGRLADVEARIQLNDEEKIDLITYDKFNTLEKDRTAIALKRAELKVAFRNSDDGTNFDTKLESLVETQKIQLLEGERGIEAKDEVFRKLRNNRAWKAAGRTLLIGGTIGFAFQEGKALLDDSQDGIIEGSIKHFTGKEDLVQHGTALEAFRRYLTGDHAMMPKGSLHAGMFEGNPTEVSLPEGVDFAQNPDGTYNLLRDGEIISDHIPVSFDAHGNLAEETQAALARSGISSEFGLCGDTAPETIHQSAVEYVRDHGEGMTKIHRELWYDNDTPHPFDQNELRTDWGGEGHTGIDANGNYVFNVARMSSEGSFHGAEGVDAAGEAQKGALKMLFSLSQDTQHQVFEVPIGPDGNAIIDPHSQLGKLMFEIKDGHAVFTGKFAEVAQSTGVAADGGENVRILSTHIGAGKDMIDAVVDKDTTVPTVLLNVPNDNTYDVPLFVPVSGRRPLERGVYETNKEVAANRPRTPDEDQTPAATPQGGPELIPPGGFKADVAENITYDPTRTESFSGTLEETVSKDTDHIYGFAGIDRKEIDTKLKGVKKYAHPEVFLFEDDTVKRAANLKQVADLRKWYPKVKFTYVALPKDIPKLEKKEMNVYGKKRLEHILKVSTVGKKVKHEFHVEPLSKGKVLGKVSESEWSQFIDTGKVSKRRIEDIAEKIKSSTELTAYEQAIRAQYWDAIEDILKK